MQKNTLPLSFYCIVVLAISPCNSINNVQTFIDLAQTYWNNKTQDTSYRNQDELEKLEELMPEAEQDLAQETRDNKKHLEIQEKISKNLANKDVYDARIAVQKALCNAQDLSPLKTALIQAKALLNPQITELQSQALKALEDSKKAGKELKTAEDFLDTQWKIFNNTKTKIERSAK